QKLRKKCQRLSHAHLSFKDNMSFLGILSTQLLVDQFINNPPEAESINREEFTVWEDKSI
ncbi:MAG: hypothetical protein U9N55_03200, partial [candidate division Zixibacteria bacterium]|nr:hypothetical protein [candidate division Zixibacteria bacterium]